MKNLIDLMTLIDLRAGLDMLRKIEITVCNWEGVSSLRGLFNLWMEVHAKEGQAHFLAGNVHVGERGEFLHFSQFFSIFPFIRVSSGSPFEIDF